VNPDVTIRVFQTSLIALITLNNLPVAYASCTQKFAFLCHSAPIFVTSLGHSEVPSVTCDRFENILKFWAL
jgi:hypothetical protein